MRQIWKQRYQIMEKLGQGGCGQVYRVKDIQLDKEWAMKEIRQDESREIQVLKQLSDRFFPRIVDAFREEGREYLVMDYIKGVTLEEVLKKGSMEERRVIRLAKQVALALSCLHEKTPALLYLDLKPSNIILEEGDEVKLVDMGSILIKGSGGAVSGTVGFASPEQVQLRRKGRELTEQSDIFSFGMLLFSMLTGKVVRLPVVSNDKGRGVSVRQFNPLVSAALERIIEKATRGAAERRFCSMRDICHQLELQERNLLNNNRLPSFLRRVRSVRVRKREWQQEKSIICTQGKTRLYFIGGSILILIGLSCFFPGVYSLAKGKSVNELAVTVRDGLKRKVLVREGGVYETEENLLFEIPWEKIEGNNCEITISCLHGNGKVQTFQLKCMKK